MIYFNGATYLHLHPIVYGGKHSESLSLTSIVDLNLSASTCVRGKSLFLMNDPGCYIFLEEPAPE